MARSGTLSPKQSKAIDCLLSAPNVTAAADCANVPRRTLYNWLADEIFSAELEKAQRQLISTAARRLAYGLDKSITTALDLAEKSEDEAVRLRAALAIPGMLRDLREHYELSERIDRLEQTMRERG